MDASKIQFSSHALSRCEERFRSRYKTREALEAFLRTRLECARRLSRCEYYHDGMVFVIKGRTVLTVTRPEKQTTQKRITRLFYKEASE